MKARKGFTLVELLIVIVIIGILAAGMLLSSGSTTDSAEASNVISDLRNLKAACLLFYGDNVDQTDLAGFVLTLEQVAPYMDNPVRITAPGSGYAAGNIGNNWFVGFHVGARNDNIQRRMASRARAIGFFAGPAGGPSDPLTHYTAGAGGNAGYVWMIAR